MRHVEVPKVERPERFFPDPVLRERPVYRKKEDGTTEFLDPKSGRWKGLHPIFLAVLEGLEKGLPFKELAENLPTFPDLHVNKRVAAKLARKFCWNLHEMGLVAFALEEPPELFHGRYERIRELGRGGLGIAHLCLDRETGREVVVKHPWGIKAPIESGQNAIAWEIAVMQDVEHPMVPRLHDHFTDRGLLHMVRDFVDGEKMRSRRMMDLMQDPSVRNRYMRQICEGLHAIHSAGYLFFDPSPDNFFLVNDQVVAADVGGCRPHEDGMLKVGGGRGTPGYVAREMRDNDHPQAGIASIRSDIWSIGCLLYYFVVGRRPKRTWFGDEILASLDDPEFRPEDRVIRDADRHVIDRCTRDDPDERPQDFLEVRDLLR